MARRPPPPAVSISDLMGAILDDAEERSPPASETSTDHSHSPPLLPSFPLSRLPPLHRETAASVAPFRLIHPTEPHHTLTGARTPPFPAHARLSSATPSMSPVDTYGNGPHGSMALKLQSGDVSNALFALHADAVVLSERSQRPSATNSQAAAFPSMSRMHRDYPPEIPSFSESAPFRVSLWGQPPPEYVDIALHKGHRSHPYSFSHPDQSPSYPLSHPDQTSHLVQALRFEAGDAPEAPRLNPESFARTAGWQPKPDIQAGVEDRVPSIAGRASAGTGERAMYHHQSKTDGYSQASSSSGASRRAPQFDVGRGKIVADGLLEVYVLEATNLPTAEFTRAFVVLQAEPRRAGPGPGNPFGADAMASLSRGVGHVAGGYDHAGNDGEVQAWGDQGSGDWASWEELRRREQGQAHKTHVVAGVGPTWDKGFRLRVRDRGSDCLRVQVLHMGRTATEFVGEVVLELKDVVDLLERKQQHRDDRRKRRPKDQSDDSLHRDGHKPCVPGEREPRIEEIPSSEMRAHDWHLQPPSLRKLRASWFALRTTAGARVRDSMGRDSEVRLGMVWRAGVPSEVRELSGLLRTRREDEDGRGRWDLCLFWLEASEQVLRYGDGNEQIGRISVRAARVEKKKPDPDRKPKGYPFEVKTPSRALLLAADSVEARQRWMDAIAAAGGVYIAPRKAPFCQRYRLLICLPLFLAVLAALAATAFAYFDDLPWNRSSKAVENPWTQCPEALCTTCDCFKRCMFGRTVAGHVEIELPHHICAGDCQCALPPPVGACGDGLVKDVAVDWYGVEVLFPEECDDGNSVSGDGCSSACAIEEYMMLLTPAQRTDLGVRDGTRTLCGSNHTEVECERACLDDPECKCAWFGGGVCHLYKDCEPTTATQANQELSYVEVEYTCGDTGPDRYDFDVEFVDIRAELILFGTGAVSEAEQELLSAQLRINMQPQCIPCITTITKHQPSVMPASVADGLRGTANPSTPTQASFRREGHDVQNMTASSSGEDREVVFLGFKLMVEAVQAEAVRARMATFVRGGVLGLTGALRSPPLFPQLLGLIVDPNDGEPTIHPRPAPPPHPGHLYRKRKFQCFPDRFPPFGNHTPFGPVREVCCGNISNVCSPMQRCYVSTMLDYDCVVARHPYPPTGAVAVPWDQRADLYWDPPEDDGGFEVLAYHIEKVEFADKGVVNVSEGGLQELLHFEVAVERTATIEPSFVVKDLVNFSPYYLRIAAINQIGRGQHSLPTPPFVPNVRAPDPPTNGVGSIGNAEVWLAWDPPTFDGGRPLSSYILEVNFEGVWSELPLSAHVLTNIPPPSGVYEVTADSPQAIIARRQLSGPSRRILESTPPPTPAPTPTPRNCSKECDPLATVFHITGDQHGNPLENAHQYQFRLSAANSFSPSKATSSLDLTPTGHTPHAVRNLSSTCHEEPPAGSSYAPNPCTSGFSDDQRIFLEWALPDYDGGSIILFYEVRLSTDGGNNFMDVHQEHVAEGDAGPWSYTVPNLENDVAYHLSVVAHNLYGNGTEVQIGPLTPRLCPHLAECGVCVEPFYDIWGRSCSPPDCAGPGTASPTVRFADCAAAGCRIEVLYDGHWGTVDGRGTHVSATDLACTELGLRPRPEVCGMASCGSLVMPAPTVGTNDFIWLRQLSCINCGQGADCCGDSCTTLTDCWGFSRERWYPPVPEPGYAWERSKWYQNEFSVHADDLGACCWPLAAAAAPTTAPPGAGSGGATAAAGAGTTPSPGAGNVVTPATAAASQTTATG